MAKPTTNEEQKPELQRKQTLPPQSEVQNACHDVIFAILFLIAFTFTIAIAFMYGNEVLSEAKNQERLKSLNNFASLKESAKYKYAFNINATIAGIALIGSLIWTLIMLVCGKMLIWMSILIICCLSLGAGLVSAGFLRDRGDEYYWWPIALVTIFVTLLLLYVLCIKNRIAFASANLQVATKAVLSYPVIMIIALVSSVLQIIWALVWIVATYALVYHGEYVNENGEEYGKMTQFAMFAGMLVIFFWASFVFRNIVMVSTAGTVTSWWHHSTEDRVPLTTTRALVRACTLSFGSICFGSLIVSIIQTIRVILKSLTHALARSGNSVAACLLGCLTCIVTCIEKWVEYFNRFAYAYVGIYGYSFISSGKRVMQLFTSKGMSAIVNDSLIVIVLLFGKIAVGILGAAIGWGFVSHGKPEWTEGISKPEFVLGFSGFLVAYSVANVIMTVIDGSVATVFILFAEDPNSLKLSHASSHESLHESWREIYPEEYGNISQNHSEVYSTA